jgi:GMP synthase-like glutamine amidotransferase
MDQKEQGEKVFEILDSDMKEKLHENDIKCYEAHWVRMVKVPENFDVLVKSNHGPEMIKHKTLSILGIQFHPEVELSQLFWGWALTQVGL